MADREQMSVGALTITDRIKFHKVYTVATLPATGNSVGDVVYCSDGVAGAAGLVMWTGADWKRVDTPATTAAIE